MLGAASVQLSGAPWGDDAAVLDHPSGRLVACVDAAVLGVHLDAALFPIEDLGYRAAVATLSDLAAMGASTLCVLVAICAPGDVDVVAIEAGVIAACEAHGCAVAGGDLSRAEVASVAATALGVEAAGRSATRAGARAGDAVVVTGPLGASAAGLRRRRAGAGLDDALVVSHRRPRALLAAGALAVARGATAMIDVSDGLARDLRRLAAASRVGVALDEVPVAHGATLDEALGGGEDYELVITHRDPGKLASGFAAAGLPAPIVIGEVVEGAGEVRLEGTEVPDVGWRH